MKKFLSLFVLSLLITLSTIMPALAAKPDRSGGDTSGKDPVGYDVSYPQCGKRLPTSAAFVIVGVNGGTAATTNECLADQLTWAKRVATGLPNQPAVQLYVNTANPGEVIDEITTWPTSNIDASTGQPTNNPHGDCTGANDMPCSWQYGWNRAVETNLDRFAPAAQQAGLPTAASSYTWWLDVETMNTWQSGSPEALARNVAALEGMASYYKSKGAKIGLYSTAVQWGEITGNTFSDNSVLLGLPNWRPSGASLSNAKANCSVDPLTTGGHIALTQYVVKNLDHNYSCV